MQSSFIFVQYYLYFFCFSYPEHEFIMRPSVAMNHETREKKSNPNVVQIDSDDDEFEDASESFTVDDDYFTENVGTKRTEPLSKICWRHLLKKKRFF